MQEFVLEYDCMPVWRDGHSFVIYEDGTVSYKKYGDESKKCSIPKNIVEEVQKTLTDKKILIDKLPEEIGNQRIDGACYYFNFMGKEISCWNICRTLEEDYKEFETYLDKIPDIYEIIRQQNSLLEIFESVYDILKDYGLTVKSWQHFGCDWEI